MECFQKFITCQQGGFYHLLHENLQVGWKNGQKFITYSQKGRVFFSFTTYYSCSLINKNGTWSVYLYPTLPNGTP